jgi:hypothetical protein
MPPLGTTTLKTSPPVAVGEAYVNFNRRIDMSMAKVPYVHYQARTAVFRKNGVRTAYTFRDSTFVPIMYRENHYQTGPAPDFRRFATAWELNHSKVALGDGGGSVFPVVDETGLVIGHYGEFYFSSVFIPEHIPDVMEEEVSSRNVRTKNWISITLEAILRADFEVYADKYNASSYYSRRFNALPLALAEMYFSLVTDINGKVVLLVKRRDVAGAQAVSYSPLDLISFVKVAHALAGRMVVRTLVRRTAAQGAKPALTAFRGGEVAKIPVQARRVTRADMMKWEAEGGHGLQKHGPQHTRESLRARVTGREEIPAPQMQPGGYRPEDFRIWRNEREAAASRFDSEEIMHRAIGDVINRNLDAIRREMKATGEIVFENQAVGFRTGAGWLSTAIPKKAATTAANAKKVEKAPGAFFVDNLRGVTIVIRRRKNHVPTANDPEEWYIHTAFPDVAVAP